MGFYFDRRGALRLREWDRYPWLVHGFGTRQAPDPTPEGLRAETLQQIHSAIVRPAGGGGRKGDALLAWAPGQLIGVKTADCLPVLVVDVRTRVAAAIHAGWRGLARRVVEKTIGEMRRQHGCKPRDLRAAIGPGIRVCCYEVGPEVIEEFASQFVHWERFCRQDPANPAWTLPPRLSPGTGHALMRALDEGRGRVDLAGAARAQLEAAGVARRWIYDSGMCTACDGDRFFSYRRERERAGRMVSVIGIVRGRGAASTPGGGRSRSASGSARSGGPA